MEISSNYDNTKEVKQAMKQIVDQVINSIRYIGNHDDVCISLQQNGYTLKQTVSFIYDTKVHFNGEDFIETEFVKFTKIENRKETYNGKDIRTTLFSGKHMESYINTELNKN